MPSCLYDKCCGCIELRTGCLIIGYIKLIAILLVMALSIFFMIIGSAEVTHVQEDEAKIVLLVVLVISIAFILVMGAFLAFIIVLLVGLHKNKRGHVKVYLIAAVICLVLSFITTLAHFAVNLQAAHIVSQLLSFAISIYFILVIRSYYYKMDDKRPVVYNVVGSGKNAGEI